jgi:aryl-alcohol dehydrogenase-like predicted oxidoreductase
MDYRRVGNSGLVVSELSLGTATFAGVGDFFGAWGDTDVRQARTLIDLCLEAGINLFDTADVYSDGASEEVLGEALRGRRDDVLISTKASLPTGPDDWGSSRSRLLRAVHGALHRLRTDHIDLFQLHGYDAYTPIDEVLQTLEMLVEQGKVRYTGVSNFSGWQLMKSLALADESHRPRYVAHQVYYSLAGRDYEWELMPLGLDQGVGAVVWSPLGWGRLSGKIRRGQPLPRSSRLHETANFAPPVDEQRLYRVIDALDRCGNRQDDPAHRAELAAPTADGVDRADRRTQRGTVETEPGGGRLEPVRGADSEARRGQRSDATLSVLPLLERAILRAQSRTCSRTTRHAGTRLKSVAGVLQA